MAQAPGIGMFGVGHPCLNVLHNAVGFDRIRTPAVTQSTQTVAKAPHIGFRQTTSVDA
jgi:hypothetical protein